QSQGLASDVTEDDKEYQVTVDIPGVDKKNIDVAYNDDILHVHVKKDATINKKDKKGDILAEERSYGEFVRNYPLPDV
ncbi:Hsp20 family protein, partial [Bacillus cereus]